MAPVQSRYRRRGKTKSKLAGEGGYTSGYRNCYRAIYPSTSHSRRKGRAVRSIAAYKRHEFELIRWYCRGSPGGLQSVRIILRQLEFLYLLGIIIATLLAVGRFSRRQLAPALIISFIYRLRIICNRVDIVYAQSRSAAVQYNIIKGLPILYSILVRRCKTSALSCGLVCRQILVAQAGL